MKTQVCRLIEQNKIIAIVRGISGKNIRATAEALLKGGIRLLEITYDQKSSSCMDDTPQAIAEVVKEFGHDITVGAGTVLTIEQANRASQAGARFALSAVTDEMVIRRMVALNMVAIPGAFSPTEVFCAHTYGADFVKVFPTGELGAGYLKSLSGPLGHIPLLAVGGITADNAAEFLSAGAKGVGVGSNLVNPKLINSGDYSAITALARDYVEAVKQ